VGEVPIRGKRLKAKAVIQASLDGHQASAEVKVIDRPEADHGPSIRIELRDEEFGNFRAQWAVHEGKPNVLLVAGRHQSLARYLGSARPDGTFAGQDSPIYRVLLAEIVAEAVCRKSLQLEARERPWDFRWANLKDDDKIADDVVAKLQRRLREFLPIAHREMVQERDARQKVIIEAV
jgi:pheromone shutdown protein TraB